MDDQDAALIGQLRAWSKGMYGLEAAVELLVRAFGGRLSRSGWPWIKNDEGTHWVDFAAIAGEAGVLSGGERRVLLLAASLGEGVPVDLSDAVSGLDRQHLGLVLAAISHAGGSHGHAEHLPERAEDGTQVITPWGVRVDLDALYPWPDDAGPG